MQTLPVENVQDYPRPPSLECVPHHLRIIFADQVVADTTKGLRVLETYHAPTYYFPLGDIRANLIPVGGGSFCEWKGQAQYFDVVMAGKVATRGAWAYARPTTSFARIAGHVAFYAGLMDACFVGEERVIPQPGDFYGGWVTSNLRGTPKGSRERCIGNKDSRYVASFRNHHRQFGVSRSRNRVPIMICRSGRTPEHIIANQSPII